MEILYLVGAILFSILWFTNLVQLLEKLHQGKNIHNQKILGCVWSACLTIFIIISTSIVF
ncbi:hypothetical protein SSIL_2255 [Solibacillus silvestris StLB046]|uniref:Uncharacterized protein n=1 Tax=Solibacillus silvestris (strain StLB046) TaxID=1002809 RepID=F2F9F1_SOLSS|nr:hypothetical protein SSIL_2255 [Solibacillus silvestris StLB046]